MKRFLIVSFLMSSLLSPCEAQTKMRDVFLQMPDSLLPYLTANNRLDFIDFLDSGMKAGVANELGGKSEMLTLTDTTLTLQASAAKLVQMQLMPVSNPVDSCNQVVCVITTYGKDAPESRIAAYSVRWRKIDVASHLALPQQPYVASFAPLPQMVVCLKQSTALDPIANETQKKDVPWLKNIEWKP